MTDEEKKKMREGFLKKKPEEPEKIEDDYWTNERLIAMAQRIKDKLGLSEELVTRINERK